jgi:hypothetical protein
LFLPFHVVIVRASLLNASDAIHEKFTGKRRKRDSVAEMRPTNKSAPGRSLRDAQRAHRMRQDRPFE